MYYKVLTSDKYKALPLEGRVEELRKWLEDQLDNHRSVLRSVAGAMPEVDPEIEEIIGVELKELPKMINDYEEGSTAHMILKYRLANGIEDLDDTVLDTDEFGETIMEVVSEFDSEEDLNTLRAHRSFSDDMISICQIFGFEALQKSFNAWKP